VTDEQVDHLRRELLIAATAARKLSVALSIAWAQLTDAKFSGRISATPGDAADAERKKSGGAEPPLPF